MPPTEHDPNLSGWPGRASDNMSVGSRRNTGNYNPNKSDTLSAAPGVMSMLRTTTEIGDVGAMSFGPTSRYASAHRVPTRQRNGTAHSRPGTASSHHSYQGSQTSRRTPNHHAWPSASSGPRRSMTSSLNVPQMLPDTMSPTLMDLPGSSPLVPRARLSRDGGRSYSMTHSSRPNLALSNHRSLTSLRSHGGGPVPRPRSPYVYPTRLKRPGYRPSSPAMSDITGIQRRVSRGLDAPNLRLRVIPPTQVSVRPQGAPRVPSQSRIPPARHAAVDPTRNGSTPSLRRLALVENSASPSEMPTPSSESSLSAPPTPAPGVSPKVQVGASSDDPEGNGQFSPVSVGFDDAAALGKQPTYDAVDSQRTLGFVQRIKSILEEKAVGTHVHGRVPSSPIPEIAELPGSEPAELPTPPVPKRITREMILAAVEPSSEKGGDDTTTSIALRLELAATEQGPGPAQPSEGSDPASEDCQKNGDASRGTSIDHSTILSEASASDESLQLSPDPSEPVTADERGPEEDASDDAVVATTGAEYQIGITVTAASECSSYSQPERTPTIDSTKIEVVTSVTSNSEKVVSRFSAPVISSPSLPTEQDASPKHISDFALRFSLPSWDPSNRPILRSSLGLAISKPPVESDTESSTHAADDTPAAAVHQPQPACEGQAISNVVSRSSFESETTTDLVLNPRRSLVAPMNSESVRALKRLSNDTTTDLRFSYFRSPPAPLPDLKEESVEDVSLPNLRSSGFRFPVPRPTSATRLPDAIRQSRESGQSSLRTTSRALSDARAIPSLNFSRLDLFSKLNEALGVRSSRSLDGFQVDLQDIHSPVPQRPSSSGMLRDRYRSWFAYDLSVDNIAKDLTTALVPSKGMISPEEFITEVNQLSIPSVNGLTERLSEWLPSMKNYLSDENVAFEEDHIESTLTEIRGLGKGRASLARVSSPDPASTIGGTDKSRNEKSAVSSKALDDQALSEGNALPTAQQHEGLNSESGTFVRSPEASADDGRRTPVAELEASTPIPLRLDQSSALERFIQASPSPAERFPKGSKIHPGASSTPNSRPWNLDESYPWADSSVTIDITVPGRAKRHLISSSESSLPRLKESMSTNNSSDGDGRHLTNQTALVKGPPQTGASAHKRRGSKRSVLESITRKIGLSGPFDNSGYPTGPEILSPGDRAVDPGDRYPTTGLNPPSAFNIEEVRSFFSDDSSHTQRGGSFRKRLTGLKSKRPLLTRAHSIDGELSIGRDNGSIFATRRSDGGGSVHTYEGTAGMSKMEFRARKVVEKLKSLWFRSGELIRSMSGRKKPQPQPEDEVWVDTSDLYSGV